jgi:hypothetical protein
MPLLPIVTDFQLKSFAINTDSSIDFLFSFVKGNAAESGYELHQVTPSSDIARKKYIDPVALDFVDSRTSQVLTSTGIIYLRYTLPVNSVAYGTSVSFYLKVFYKEGANNSLPYTTTLIPFRTPVSPVTNITAYYDGFSATLEWAPVEEELASSYRVYASKMRLINDASIDSFDIGGTVFKSEGFVLNNYVVIENAVTGVIWTGFVVRNGIFYINNFNVKNTVKFFSYPQYVSVNYNIYTVSPTEYTPLVEVPKSQFTGAVSYVFPSDDAVYAFRVLVTGGDLELYSLDTYIKMYDTSYRQPLPYPIYEHEDELYGNQYFFGCRYFLVDENYYNKDTYALPYKDRGEDYLLKGFIGVAGALIKLVVDDDIYQVVISDKKGEFRLNFNTDKKTFRMSILASLSNGLESFVNFEEVVFDKIIAYTPLGVLSKQIGELSDEILATAKRLLITETSLTIIQQFFAPQIKLTRGFQDTDAEYVAQVQFLYPLLFKANSGGTEQILQLILDFYYLNAYNILDYSFESNGDPMGNNYNAFHLGDTMLTYSGQLENKKYKYFVTAQNSSVSTIESFPVTISVDYRIFDGPTASTYPAICLTWDAAGKDTDVVYNIYRQVDNNPVRYLGQVTGLAFVDDGTIVEQNRNYPEFGYCNINPVSGLRFMGNMTLHTQLTYQYSKNFLILVLYQDALNPIKDSVKTRIENLVRDLIFPEIFFKMRVINI